MSELKELFDQRLSGVIQNISPHDEMYLGNKEHYFQVGQSAIQCIKIAILASGRDFSDIKTILDLPCGYGRVSRMLKVAFPDARLIGCDLLRDAVDYCAQVFGTDPLYSEKQIHYVKTQDKFDLVWCGSLMTHLNSNRWYDFLHFFYDVLAPKGILIFTTHGRFVADLMRSKTSNYGISDSAELHRVVYDYDHTGFGYANYFHSNEYGISVSSPSYVLHLIEQQGGLRILSYMERGWDNHQDVIACIKDTP